MTPPTYLEAWGVREIWIDEDGWRKSRKSLQDILEMEGWVAGPMKLVRANQSRGWHRFEFMMRETK